MCVSEKANREQCLCHPPWNLYSYVRNNPINATDPDGNVCTKDGYGNYEGDCQSTGDEKVTQGGQPQTVQVNAQAGFSFWDGLYFTARLARTIQTNGDKLANLIERIPAPPEIPESWKLAIGMTTGFPEAEIPEILEGGSSLWSMGAKNALTHWLKHGKEFPGLLNAKQYAEAAKDFVTNPPLGTLSKLRPNGDTVLYNSATNTFAVKTAGGVPRTMFKPSGDGMAYFSKQ